MALYKYEKYYITHDALMTLTFIPALIIFFCTLCMARRRRDPARTAFTYLKAAWAFFLAFCLLDIFAYAAALAYTRVFKDQSINDYLNGNDKEDILLSLLKAQAHGSTVANFFNCFTDIFVFIMLERIGNGILITQNGTSGKLGQIFRFASYGISVLLGALALAVLGLRVDFHDKLYKNNATYLSGQEPGDIEQFTQSRQIDFSFRVLVFILALCLVARSIMVKIQTRTEPLVKTASTFYIACCGLWLLQTVYSMAIIPSLVKLDDARDDDVGEDKDYVYIIDVVFAVWPIFVLLCLASALGAKKRNGLWSTEQPFMMVNPNQPQTAWGYGYDPSKTGEQPPQPTWQQTMQQPVYQPPLQQTYIYQQPAHQYAPHDPAMQSRSPPPHEDAMGLYHQADGTPPQASPQPYPAKN